MMPGNENIIEQYCSISSSQAAESLIGSTPRTDFWILLDYPHPNSAKALKENLLPDEVNGYLAAVQESLPDTRVLLISKPPSRSSSNPILILADGREGSARLYKLPLNNYFDLLEVDIPAIFAGDAGVPALAGSEALFLVCTNGKRDACCAKWGVPLFNILQQEYGDMVFQSSHVGGHRFAPNLICLPHGIYYGRVPVLKAGWIAERYLSGHLSLDYYRGLAGYPAAAQAAETFLRIETGDDRLGIYHLERISPLGENRWEVRFSDERNRVAFLVQIESRQTGTAIFENCHSPSEMKPVKEYRLLRPILTG
jgi:hypothetical protein